MEILGRYIYGSGNSLDTDMVYLVDQLPGSIAECKAFCDEMKHENENLNIAVIEGGVISKCFKGTVDELNNAIYMTYKLHEQDTPLMINRMVDRDKYLKVIRAVRSILSHFSKSCLRPEIKSALKGSWEERLNALVDISSLREDEVDFDSLNPNMSGRDVMKLVAFQIGQTMALLIGDEELFTKDEIGYRFEDLSPYLKRSSDDWKKLSEKIYMFADYLANNFMFRKCDNPTEIEFIDFDDSYVYDLKLEKRIR